MMRLAWTMQKYGMFRPRRAMPLFNFTRAQLEQANPADDFDDMYEEKPHREERLDRMSDEEFEELRSLCGIERWLSMSDAEIGGSSESSFELSPEDGGKTVFSGRLSKAPSKHREIGRTGYCSVYASLNTWQQDVSGFTGLQMTFRADARIYSVNVKPLSCIPDDLYMGFLFLKEQEQGEWVTATLPFSDLMLTGRGQMKSTQREFDHDLIAGVGFTIQGEQEGDFKLEVKDISVVNLETTVDVTAGAINMINPPGYPG